MAVYGCVWLCRALYGYVWLRMAVYGSVGLCRAGCGYVWLCKALYGCVWLCMAVYGCVLLCSAMYGCVWLCRATYWCVWLCRAMYGLDCEQPLVFLISQSRACARCEERAAKPLGTRAPARDKTRGCTGFLLKMNRPALWRRSIFNG